MKNKKGFTMVEMLVTFIIIIFVMTIGVVSYRFIIDKVEANYYKTLEEELLLAGSDYFTNHREDKPLSGYSAVYIDELVGDKYISVLKDRKGNICSSSNDSKVYIYKTDTGYDYETCLVCNEYETKGAYCDGVAMGVINISAVKEDGTEYNPLLSFGNNSWSNSDVHVTFSVNVPVTNFVITNNSNGSTMVCDDIENNHCTMTFNTTSTYVVEAYNGSDEVAPDKGFNIKIDTTNPVCEFISGPSVSLINNNSTATYVLECKDNIGIDDYSLSASDFQQTSSNVVLIQEPISSPITNGYQYTITVTGNVSGTSALILTSGSITDHAGNGNISLTSDSLVVDATAPDVEYSLASGTYDEEKNVVVTVTDNRKISSIEYQLYKDSTLVSSGNPIISSSTTVTFDVDLDDDGRWKLTVVAVDEAGNMTTSNRSYVISLGPVCTDWVLSSSGYYNVCSNQGSPDYGTTYSVCSPEKWKYTKSMYCDNDITGDPETITSSSGYSYDSEASALSACERYNLTCGSTGSISEPWCSASKASFKETYTRTCQ